ncbi:MAG: HNH endonuclease [Patescibacteria group bacterium]|nr:HNH endonuclease [Patescibacteria group bacterium]
MAARVLLLALGTFSDYADRFMWDESKLRAHMGAIWSPSASDELLAAGILKRDSKYGKILFAFGFRRRRFSRWERLRSTVFERDGHRCVYCGASDLPLHCDHVIPVSRGGSNDMSNLATACAPCNLSKSTKTLDEWRKAS